MRVCRNLRGSTQFAPYTVCVYACVCERERMYVRVRERERERESVCVSWNRTISVC